MTVRAFLRAVSVSQWNLEYAAAQLRVSRRRAGTIIERLVELGYVEAVASSGDRSYKRSLAGSTLAQASAAQPLRRDTAERKLADFLARVRRINEDDSYLYRVKKVLVFGSYLTAAEQINDIDVAIELAHRWDDLEKQEALRDARVGEAIRNGRRFGNISEEVSWPETEVLLALKARSRAISLHPAEDAILERADRKTVFEDVESLPK